MDLYIFVVGTSFFFANFFNSFKNALKSTETTDLFLTQKKNVKSSKCFFLLFFYCFSLILINLRITIKKLAQFCIKELSNQILASKLMKMVKTKTKICAHLCGIWLNFTFMKTLKEILDIGWS